MKKLLILLLFVQFQQVNAHQSIFTDSTFINRVKLGIDNIYNFEFDKAEVLYSELQTKYPEHPFTQLYYSIMMYWKYFPIVPESEHHNAYVANITKAVEYTESELESEENDAEAVFFNLMARLLIMQYYADNNLSSKVIPHIGRAYKMVNKGFEMKNQITDFYLSTGIYNYYRKAYPEAHPVYKPFAYFFPDGDIELGLKQLEYNWHNGIFLDAESLFYLAYIYLNFEKDYDKSLKYVKQLNKEYPQNPLYLTYRIRILLLQNKYTAAHALTNKLKKMDHSNDYFKIVANTYLAIIYEKKFKNYRKAGELYTSAIKDSEKYGSFINDNLSYAYFGLARIYAIKDKKLARQYKKRALDIASYPHINFD